MRRTIFAILLATLAVAGATPDDFSFVILGRPSLESRPADIASGDLIEAAVFLDEPLAMAIRVANMNADEAAVWGASVDWTFATADGAPVKPQPCVRLASKDGNAEARPLRPLVTEIRFSVRDLPAGRYIVRATSVDAAGDRVEAEARALSVYRGDESPLIRGNYLQYRAAKVLVAGTKESYDEARRLLLEAADGNPDPGVYETLADASSPWANPEETADYYECSVAVARQGMEQRWGIREGWPEQASALLARLEGKVNAFRALVPYYRANFDNVRVTVVGSHGLNQTFAIGRRSDGLRLRTVLFREP